MNKESTWRKQPQNQETRAKGNLTPRKPNNSKGLYEMSQPTGNQLRKHSGDKGPESCTL